MKTKEFQSRAGQHPHKMRTCVVISRKDWGESESLTVRSLAAHVWYTYIAKTMDPDVLRYYADVMTPKERMQQQRFALSRDRHRFLVTRGLVRTILSRYANVGPHEWEFGANRYGKPFIERPDTAARLKFNVSHTSEVVACAIAVDLDIGVDIEDLRRIDDSVGILYSCFSPIEISALESAPLAERKARFIKYWVLKESFVKACGMGLSVALDTFAFHFGSDGSPRITFGSAIHDDPSSWKFAQFMVDARHCMAVALRHAIQSVTITVGEYKPLSPGRKRIPENV